MKQIKTTMLVWLAMCAVCVVGTSSASAEVALWLANGNTVTSTDLFEYLLELTLEFKTLLGNIDELCHLTYDGTIDPNGAVTITEVLSLTGVPIPRTLSTGTGLDCTVVSGTLCSAGELVEWWPDNLPWNGQLELMAAGAEEYLDVIGQTGGLPGWHMLCANGVSNLCEGAYSETLKNGIAGEVEGVTSRTKAEKCEAGEGFFESDSGTVGTMVLTSGEPLTVSME